MNTDAPDWAMRGLRPWTLAISLPICLSLLIGPLADPTPGVRSVSAWVVALTVAVLFIAAVLTRYRPGTGSKRAASVLLALLAGFAVTTTLAWSPAWSALFVLLAVGVGVALVQRSTAVLILLIVAVAVAVNLLAGASPDAALVNGLTVLLSGLGTHALHQLFAAVAELRCTRQELAQLAVSQERDRFARDLHDLLGHTLSVIVVKAEAVRRLAPLDSIAAAGHAADIEHIGREALTDIRRAASGYRGAGLDRELSRAREALAASGVGLSLDQQSGSPLPEETDILLGWAVREGVTNVVRHARATHCTIGVRHADHGVRLTIEDDGSGRTADGDPPPHPGTGLLGLSERVAAVGGTVAAEPTDRGFRITVDVPGPAEKADEMSAR
jgi:two-component system, NarL family, sensor histidine kinase DesK